MEKNSFNFENLASSFANPMTGAAAYAYAFVGYMEGCKQLENIVRSDLSSLETKISLMQKSLEATNTALAFRNEELEKANKRIVGLENELKQLIALKV